MNPQRMTKRERIKDLSNKAEGIYQYVGSHDMLFRLIETGNSLASEINHAVALFSNFARSGEVSDFAVRSTINDIYRKVGSLMCDIDIIHAAAGEPIMPDTYKSIDFCYAQEYRILLREAALRGMPENYRGPQQNPYAVDLKKPYIEYIDPNDKFDFDPPGYEDSELASMTFPMCEEPRDRKLVFRCTKAELDDIKRYASIIEVKYTEEDIHHA